MSPPSTSAAMADPWPAMCCAHDWACPISTPQMCSKRSAPRKEMNAPRPALPAAPIKPTPRMPRRGRIIAALAVPRADATMTS